MVIQLIGNLLIEIVSYLIILCSWRWNKTMSINKSCMQVFPGNKSFFHTNQYVCTKVDLILHWDHQNMIEGLNFISDNGSQKVSHNPIKRTLVENFFFHNFVTQFFGFREGSLCDMMSLFCLAKHLEQDLSWVDNF